MLVDADERTFFYRTTQAGWLENQAEGFYSAIETLLCLTLDSERVQKSNKANERGSHFPCIIGHYRQYSKVSWFVLCSSILDKLLCRHPL
jgi:hypothetical protein